MSSEVFPANSHRETEEIIDKVAMPLFELGDTSLLFLDNGRYISGADTQSQILLSYGGCETPDRVFSSGIGRGNTLGLHKFIQALSSAPILIGMILSFQGFFFAFSSDLIRMSPLLAILVSTLVLFATYVFMFASLSGAVLFARRTIRARIDRPVSFLSGLFEPDHIAISPQGINLQWSGSFMSFTGFALPWKRIALAYVEDHKDPFSDEEFEVLCIRDNLGKAMRLDCRVFASEILITALQKRAPWSIKAPPMVLTVQPPQLSMYAYLSNWGFQIARNLTQPVRPRAALTVGTSLQQGRYTITESMPIKRVGTDHIARVATQNQNPTQLAVRAIHCAELLENSTLVKLRQFILPAKLDIRQWYWTLTQFEIEVRRMSMINDNNIARWLDVFMEDGSLFFVTEYDASPNLRQVMEKSAPLTEHKVKEMALEMCEILMHLHHLEPPYVHRAFTPDSIVRTQNNFLKLNEFPIGDNFLPSKLTAAALDRRYTSPDLLNGFASTQADIYSLGGTLFYLLTGEDPTPFQQSDVRSKRPEISQAFCDIIKKATDPVTNKRFDSAEAVKTAILDIANAETSLILL